MVGKKKVSEKLKMQLRDKLGQGGSTWDPPRPIGAQSKISNFFFFREKSFPSHYLRKFDYEKQSSEKRNSVWEK